MESGLTRNPWVGLRPFAPSEADLFFGREREKRILADLVATLPLLIVYAPSGTGKSSLLNAGLTERLRRDRDHVLVLQRDPRGDVVATTRNALAEADWLAPEPAGLGQLLHRHWAETARRTVVVIDQFEERFNAGLATEELFEVLAELANTGSDAGCVVLSIREDYLGNLEPLIRRVPGLLNASYRVPPLSRDALERAIHGPLEAQGGATAESALIDATLDDLTERATRRQEPGEQRFEPGYFQIVWSTLWEHKRDSRLRLADYRALGGASTILKEFTAGVLAALEPADREVFYAISRYLVLPTGAKIALTVDDLASLVHSSDFLAGGLTQSASWLTEVPAEQLAERIRRVLRELTASDAPLFQRVIRSDREEHELLHDLLGRILLDWREQFRRTIEDEAAAKQSAIAEAAKRRVAELRLPPGTDPRPLRAAAGEPIIRDAIAQVRSYRERIELPLSERDVGWAVHESDELFVTESVVSSVKSMMEFDDHWRLSSELRQENGELARTVSKIALTHPSEGVRRAFQGIARWRPGSAVGFIATSFKPSGALVAIVAIAVALAALPTAVAALAVAGAVGGLDVDYAWLIDAHIVAAFAFLFGVLLIDASAKTARGALRLRASRPRTITGPPATRFLRRLFVWPLPPAYTVVAGLLGAWLFDRIGWPATVGYVEGAVIGGLGALIGAATLYE